MDGGTGKREGTDAVAASSAKRPRTEPNSCSFVIPSGETFDISLSALRCEPLRESLLTRLVDSSLSSDRDAAGAIKISFKCTATAMRRVVDEYEWTLHVATHNEELGVGNLRYCGPPLQAAIHPNDLLPLWDYLGLDKALIGESRVHPNTPAHVLVAYADLLRGHRMLLQLDTFVRVVERTLDIRADRLVHGDGVQSPYMSLAILAKSDVQHFSGELFELLMQPERLRHLCCEHGRPDLAAKVRRTVRMRPGDKEDLARIQSKAMRSFVPAMDSNGVPLWMDVASRPIGCFAVSIARHHFYHAYKENIILRSFTLDIALTSAVVKLQLDFRTGDVWAEDTASLPIDITAKVLGVEDASSMPTLVLKLCQAHAAKPGETASINLQREIRKIFQPIQNAAAAARSHPQKLVSYEDVPDGVYTGEPREWEHNLTPLPWMTSHRSGPISERNAMSETSHGCCLDDWIAIDRQDQAEKDLATEHRAKRCGNLEEDELAWVHFIFSVTEADCVPPFTQHYGSINQDFLVLDISA